MEPIEWRSFFLKKPSDFPTYRKDVTGAIDRFDERDCIFARMDLRPGSERYNAYYAGHEEFEAADTFLRSLPPLGSTAAAVDRAILDALFDTILAIGALDAVISHRSSVISHELGGGDGGEGWDGGDASARIKSLARYLGADLVGTGPLDPAHVYSHVGRTPYGQEWGTEVLLDHPRAISMGFAMDFGFLKGYAPGFPVIIESALAYAMAAKAAIVLARYIRSLGYSARAHHLRDYQVLSVPVAIDAGLGELGRAGILITREFGTSIRLSTVTTDMPLALDAPIDLGVQGFCKKCSLCAMSCPSGAIPRGEKVEVRGVRRWKLSAGRCYHYWRTCGSDCALCVVACPWSKPDSETAHLRPHREEPPLDTATLDEVARLRGTLPPWLQKILR